MGKPFIKSGLTEIEKHKFHQHETLVLTENIDIDKIVGSNKVCFGKTSFNILLLTKMIKNRHSYISFSKKDACR